MENEKHRLWQELIPLPLGISGALIYVRATQRPQQHQLSEVLLISGISKINQKDKMVKYLLCTSQ